MSLSEEIRRLLPVYLPPDAQEDLFAQLKQFPDNMDARIYSGVLPNEGEVFQGDGFNGLLLINLPKPEIAEGPGMILSNSCDISSENRRFLPPRFIYCPILKLSNYIGLLERNGVEGEVLKGHIEAIRAQRITSVLFLPQAGNLKEDCLVFLDRINNCDLAYLSEERVKANRLFSLSDYGFYLFLVKLSIHLTRIREGMERGYGQNEAPATP
jgi:hypothetical protein